MAKQRELATQQDTALAPLSGTARGFDNFKPEDLIVPRLRLLQGLSQAVVDGQGTIGQFQDSLTGEILGDKIEIVLMGLKNGAVLFEMGKGMICKSHDGLKSIRGDHCEQCPYGEYWNKAWEHDQPPKCSATKDFMVVTRKTLSASENKPYVISFLKTSYKTGKKLASMARLTGLDIFAAAYVVTSEKIKNDKGTFSTLIVTPHGKLTPEEFKSAEAWFNVLNAGNVKVYDEDVQQEPVDDINI